MSGVGSSLSLGTSRSAPNFGRKSGVVRKQMNPAKRLVVEPEPEPAITNPSADPWAELTAQLQRRGRAQGLTWEDAEDRAQEALIRLVKERPTPDAPSIEVRAARAHRLAEVTEFRTRNLKRAVPPEALVHLDREHASEIPVEVDLDARIRLSELIAAVVDLAGSEGMKFLLEGEAGYTEAESDERRSPNSPSTGALRKRLARAGREIAARINHDLEGDR